MARGGLGLLAVSFLFLAPAHAAGTMLELGPAQISHAVAVTGEPVEIIAPLRNAGGTNVANVSVDLYLPPGWRSDPIRIQLPAIAPYTTQNLRFRAVADQATHGGGKLMVNAPSLNQPLMRIFPLSSCRPLELMPARFAMRQRSMALVPEDKTIYVTTGSYLIFLPRCTEEYGPGLVYVRKGDEWDRVATFPALGRVIYEDSGPDGGTIRAEHWIFAQKTWIPRDPRGDYLMTLKDEWTDFRGRQWTAKAWLGPTTDPRIIKYSQMVRCSKPASIYRFEGPLLSVGDGTFGTARPAYLAPGAPQVAPDQPVLVRSAPAGDGCMAVQRPGGGVIGLFWDPRQPWAPGESRPQALFASPNQVFHRQNQYLSLVVPAFGARQSPLAIEAAEPYDVAPNTQVWIRAEFYAAADETLEQAQAFCHQRYGGRTLPGLSAPAAGGR